MKDLFTGLFALVSIYLVNGFLFVWYTQIFMSSLPSIFLYLYMGVMTLVQLVIAYEIGKMIWKAHQ